MSYQGERHWSSAADFDQAATRRDVEGEADTLRLRRGVTLRDEVGRTNGRHTERITQMRWARKQLVIDHLGSNTDTVYLCPYFCGAPEGSKLEIEVNGHTMEWVFPEKPEYWNTNWQQIEVLVEYLQVGLNQFIFRGAGPGEWHLLMESSLWPDRSAVSEDAGQTWRSDEIGDNDRSDGEYVVRLWLDQYAHCGEVVSAPVDLLAIAAGHAVAPSGEVKAADVELTGDCPAGTSCEIQWRQGTTPAYDPATWSAWAALTEGAVTGSRFGQWRLQLATSDPSVTPVVKGVALRVEAQGTVQPDHPVDWTVTADVDNAPLVRSSHRFAHMPANDSRGQILRDRWQLDKVVGPAKTEFEALVLLRQWVREQWEDGWNMGPLDYVPPWDAPVILELAGQQLALGMCTHYATVFTQCCAALGFYARTQIMRCHCITEVWSNDYRKWVTMDPGGDSSDETKHTYHFERDGVPLSALETHLAWVNEDYADVKMSPPPAPATKDRFTLENRMHLWSRFMISMRNDETTTLEPGEPEHGKCSYHYDGYLFWHDEKTPPLPHYSRQTERIGDLYWDLHRVHMHLQAGAEGLVIDLDTETPNLAHFEIRLDGGGWEERPACFTVPLHDGENRIEARVVNKHGRAGSISHVTVAA
ncbi:MAG: transglutaminase domain-containing protein [Gemmatimonadetes bacterium]|jgi:hypothetical protein|nr:transglutaminase domain-containing protein [Gemmatimonadota bacterium]MBT7859622.1 transglutaminase domain-containing protein [Gemmatimonadota bacterium]